MATAEPAVQPTPQARPQRPELTEEQKRLILGAVGELVRSAVTAQPAQFPDPSLAGAADHSISGAFVSLKRKGHLRSCCGGLVDRPIRLGNALQDAAVRTALDDMRFPQVSPTELEHLDMEVWLLFNPEPAKGRGPERVHGVITGGKHGLMVMRGDARGILLPGVAVDHNWDSEKFLEQVCVKAGLHPTLWKDEETAIFTFEGEAIRGPVLGAAPPSLIQPNSLFRPEELTAYLQFCRNNIALALAGATPQYYLFGVSDGNISGVVLRVRRPAEEKHLTLCQVSLRPGLPLQSTLFNLAHSAAQALAKQGISAAELDNLEVGLLIVNDSAMHGTVADPHLAGIDAGRRAVMVSERSKIGIVYDPQSKPAELVSQAVEYARINHPTSVPIFSLHAYATEAPVTVSIAPRPVRGPDVRPPGVAGAFYPAEAEALSKLVDDLLDGNGQRKPYPAALVPHAGLIYSGRIAAGVLRRIQHPGTIIILGPKHTPLGVDWAVAPHQTWSIPGFQVQSDPQLAEQLAQAIPGLELDAQAHQREHAIEVELPFLARLAPQARVVGIAMGAGDLESCQRFAEGLAKVLKQRSDHPLLLISSDMNHFATDVENRRLDEIALAALESLDPANVYDTVTQNQISMCGLLPAVVVLETLRRLDRLHDCERVGYGTSADVSGDTSRVVGYAGMLFS